MLTTALEGYYNEHGPYVVVSSIVEVTHPSLNIMILLSRHAGYYKNSFVPFIIFNTEDKNFYVYKHIRLDAVILNDIVSQIGDHINIREPLRKEIVSQISMLVGPTVSVLNGKIAAKQLEESSAAISNYVMKNPEPISLKGFAIAHLNLRDRGLDKALTAIETALCPPDLCEARTAEEIENMYEVAALSSCMHSGSPAAGWKNLFKKSGVHPTAWYAYVPHMRGVYMKNKEGKTVARTFIYRKDIEKEEWTHYGRIYAVDGTMRDVCAAAIVSKYGKQMRQLSDDAFEFTTTFSVPVIKFDGKEWIPIPYTDNIMPHTFMAYDEEKNEVVCSHNDAILKRKVPNAPVVPFNTLTTNGYINVTQYLKTVKKCAHCGRGLQKEMFSVELNGRSYSYCSEGCAVASDWKIMSQFGGHNVLVTNLPIRRSDMEHYGFSTVAAAIAHGAYPYLGDDIARPFKSTDPYSATYTLPIARRSTDGVWFRRITVGEPFYRKFIITQHADIPDRFGIKFDERFDRWFIVSEEPPKEGEKML